MLLSNLLITHIILSASSIFILYMGYSVLYPEDIAISKSECKDIVVIIFLILLYITLVSL